MPGRSTTVRFGEELWELLEREAAEQGVSAAQYVRDAVVLQLAFAMARRGDAAAQETLADVAARSASRRERAAQPAAHPVLADPARRAALARTGLVDSPADEAFDRLASLAARVLNAPVALVSLVEVDRQFLKSCVGLREPWSTARQAPLSHSFCRHPVVEREPFLVTDAREDDRVRANLAVRDLDVVAYAGIPLITRDGHALGSLCVIDHRPRTWTREQVDILRDIGASVMTEIELRQA